MIRDVDLVAYLPNFVQVYKEPVATLETENIEFAVAWDAVNKIMYNRFISTADEYGISQFERLLGIYPSTEDTLEGRRSKIQSRWFQTVPYTINTLLRNLTILCKDSDFVLTANFEEGYTLFVETELETFAQIEELENLIDTVIPCNIMVVSNNILQGSMTGKGYLTTCMTVVETVTITNEGGKSI